VKVRRLVRKKNSTTPPRGKVAQHLYAFRERRAGRESATRPIARRPARRSRRRRANSGVSRAARSQSLRSTASAKITRTPNRAGARRSDMPGTTFAISVYRTERRPERRPEREKSDDAVPEEDFAIRPGRRRSSQRVTAVNPSTIRPGTVLSLNRGRLPPSSSSRPGCPTSGRLSHSPSTS
jgi:hypothetical protein